MSYQVSTEEGAILGAFAASDYRSDRGALKAAVHFARRQVEGGASVLLAGPDLETRLYAPAWQEDRRWVYRIRCPSCGVFRMHPVGARTCRACRKPTESQLAPLRAATERRRK